MGCNVSATLIFLSLKHNLRSPSLMTGASVLSVNLLAEFAFNSIGIVMLAAYVDNMPFQIHYIYLNDEHNYQSFQPAYLIQELYFPYRH